MPQTTASIPAQSYWIVGLASEEATLPSVPLDVSLSEPSRRTALNCIWAERSKPKLEEEGMTLRWALLLSYGKSLIVTEH